MAPTNLTNSNNLNETEFMPWIYDIEQDDTNWIMTSSFIIFTMQTGLVKKDAKTDRRRSKAWITKVRYKAHETPSIKIT